MVRLALGFLVSWFLSQKDLALENVTRLSLAKIQPSMKTICCEHGNIGQP